MDRSGKRFLTGILTAALIFSSMTVAYAQNVAQHLQDVSVTIKSGFAEGSGVLITRELTAKDNEKIKKQSKSKDKDQDEFNDHKS